MTQTPSDWDEGALNNGTPTGLRLRAPYLETQEAIGKLTQGSNAPLWSGITGAPFVTVSPVGITDGYPENNGADLDYRLSIERRLTRLEVMMRVTMIWTWAVERCRKPSIAP